MSDSTFAEIAAQHRAIIVEEFTTGDPHAECSCGWIGEPVTGRRGPLGRHLALGDHAAHVHLVAGLATWRDE